MRKRSQHGKKSEKPKETPESDSASDGSKDADEDKYIENGSKNDVPPTDDDQDEEEEYTAPAEPQKKAALDFFNGFFKSVTEGRSDYELIAQEVLG